MTKRVSNSMKILKKEMNDAIKNQCFDNFLDIFDSQILRYNEHSDCCETFLLTAEIEMLCTLVRAMFWDYRNELETVFKDNMDYVDAVIKEIHPKYYRNERVIQYDIWDYKRGLYPMPKPITSWTIHLP